jgi:hypothetical protein
MRKPMVMPRAAAMLSDASDTIATTLRSLKSQAQQQTLSPKQTTQLLQLLQALEKTHILERTLAQELALEQLDDAQLANRARDAIAALGGTNVQVRSTPTSEGDV